MENSAELQIANSETIENNKLIAEFMDVKLKGGGKSIFDEPNLKLFRITEYDKDGLCEYCHNGVDHGRNIQCYVLDAEKLQYNTDWNWLMPVVAKITQDSRFIDQEERETLMDVVPYGIMEDVYHFAVKFIQWYNENK